MKEPNSVVARFTPCEDNVLIRPTAALKKTGGGIVIPENAKQQASSGTVVAAGPGRWSGGEGADLERVTPSVEVGDRVHFSEFQTSPVTLGGEKLLLIKDSMIYGVEAPE